MTDNQLLAERFEEHRSHLRAVAYRLLGSLGDADDAVQECWFRLSRSDSGAVENMKAWLTTVVARICLDMLRSRKARREESLSVRLPDPILSSPEGMDPEQEALVADSVGLALLVVLDTLSPAERIAFVLHDVFAVPFDEIAPVLGRTPVATRQLASRARRRVQGAPAVPDDLDRQREVVDAFLAASREGRFDALVSLLDPDVVLRADGGPTAAGVTQILRGAAAVASQARRFSQRALYARPALVNGAPGALIVVEGRLITVGSFVVQRGKIVAMDFLADAERLNKLDIPAATG